MRRVERREDLEDALRAAMREAESAFGDATVFLEEAVVDPRHIEVQILADNAGNVIHLYERDCSVQRRHQKVVEIAPAPNLDPSLREQMCAHAVTFARAIGYVNAGTVEFLLSPDGRYVFIEMNPRIQVEHTITEEVTDVDIVTNQLRIASGATLPELGLTQDRVQLRGAALQCRITTEDPANGFRPDTGRITVYRSAGGAGVRLDGGTVFVGAEIGAHFDSMLVKVTCRGADFATAVRRSRRVLAEFRIRGCRNQHPIPAVPARRARLRRRPPVDLVHRGASRSAHLPYPCRSGHQAADLSGRGDGQQALRAPARDDLSSTQAAGHRPRDTSGTGRTGPCLLRVGPEQWARDLRAQKAVGVTDTTFRDAHQSLLGHPSPHP